MKILAFRMWKMSHERAIISALEEYAEEQHVSTGTRIVLLRRATDPYPHHDLIQNLVDKDIPFISITERDSECDDNSPEIQKVVKRWDEIIESNRLAEKHYRKQRMSGRNQMVLEDTIVHVNGVPFILRPGMRIEGNTDLRWAAALTTPITEKFDIAHDAQHITERREYERLHPVPELTYEQKRMILDDMYDPNNIGGHT